VVFITRYQLPSPELAKYHGTARVVIKAANRIKLPLSFQTKTLPYTYNLASIGLTS